MVQILPPPPALKPEPIFHRISTTSPILRLYDPTKYGADARSFRSFGPISRFDHHTLPQGSSASRAILYAGSSVRGCLVEVFGDTRVVDVGFWMIAKMTSKRELQLLDLRGGNAMKAGTVASVCKDSNRAYSQEWSRYFYENHFLYEPEPGAMIDGLIFGNAHNDEDAMAFYERSETAFEVKGICQLRDASLRTEIRLSAIETGMCVIPY